MALRYTGAATSACLHLILDLPADLLQRLLLGLGERQLGRNRVTFGHQRAALFLGQDQRS